VRDGGRASEGRCLCKSGSGFEAQFLNQLLQLSRFPRSGGVSPSARATSAWPDLAAGLEGFAIVVQMIGDRVDLLDALVDFTDKFAWRFRPVLA